MAIQPTFLLIADIAGYTRFMKFHQASLAHAQDIVAQLLEAVIDATQPHLKLAKLEGDAAFFYIAYPPGIERAASHALELDDLGRTDSYYVDLERYVGEVPPSPRLSLLERVVRHTKLAARSLPEFLGLRRACVGFRNIPDAPPVPNP